MRLLLAMLVASFALVLSPAGAEAFKYTHRLYVSGELTDNWSEVDPEDCGLNGNGSLKVSFKTTRPVKVRVFRDKVGSRPRTKGVGLWALAVPGGAGHTHAPPVKVDATMTTSDARVPVPIPPTFECSPNNTKGCGTQQIKPALVKVGGYDPKNLYSSYTLGEFRSTTLCEIGRLTSWIHPFDISGGDNRFGDFIFKMPSASSVRRKRTITLTRSNHETASGPRSENGPGSVTDDVTRKFTITLKKL
ncbi:MAG: hypothetical protein JHC98_03215 [Thermoleophilaceae bacterium]|nr:hypothetical protein [Thermoleophilaceae bacterium]